MRYGPIPETLGERVALALGRVPVPVMDAVFSIVKARALMAAVRLGVFEVLRHGGRPAGSIAAQLSLDPEATELLLRTLVYGGYLIERDGGFALSRLARRTLLVGAPMELRAYVEWNHVQWQLVERMEEVVRSGRNSELHESIAAPEDWERYGRAMLELARLDAPFLARRVPVRPGAQQMLDLGGAHGLLGAAICRRHPPMRSRVIDLPQAAAWGRRLAREAAVDDVVEHESGDVRTTDLGHDRDVVLTSNLLHHLATREIEGLIVRSHAALARGGTLAIWEIEAPPRGSAAGSGDGAALFFRLTSGSRCHDGATYARWLQEAGLVRVRITRSRAHPGSVLIVGRRR